LFLAIIVGFFAGTGLFVNKKQFICNYKGHNWGKEMHKDAWLWEQVCERCGEKRTIDKTPAPTPKYKCSKCGKEVRSILDLQDFSAMHIHYQNICKSCYEESKNTNWREVDENRW
jgi:DNA-directed RNA polymerase subunit RPC12/RpoP